MSWYKIVTVPLISQSVHLNEQKEKCSKIYSRHIETARYMRFSLHTGLTELFMEAHISTFPPLFIEAIFPLEHLFL